MVAKVLARPPRPVYRLASFRFRDDSLKMVLAILFAFLAFCAAALAAPVGAGSADGMSLLARDVVDPKITSPTASTVWVVGNTFEVTW